MDKTIDALILKLGWHNTEPQNRDHADFRDLHILSVKAALRDAYLAGQQSVCTDRSSLVPGEVTENDHVDRRLSAEESQGDHRPGQGG